MPRIIAIAALTAVVLTVCEADTLSPAATGAILQTLAQQDTADPLLEEVNAELDRRGTDSDAESPPAPSAASRGVFYYLRVLSALCLVVALIIAVGYAARRAAGRTPLLASGELGRVLGRLYLSRNTTLFFVETGGQVLVIGATGQSVSTLAQFDAALFNPEEPLETTPELNPETFLAQLTSSSRSLQSEPRSSEDDDMTSLRKDIQRLQDYLREESREIPD